MMQALHATAVGSVKSVIHRVIFPDHRRLHSINFLLSRGFLHVNSAKKYLTHPVLGRIYLPRSVYFRSGIPGICAVPIALTFLCVASLPDIAFPGITVGY